jgi:hypothetical protein
LIKRFIGSIGYKCSIGSIGFIGFIGLAQLQNKFNQSNQFNQLNNQANKHGIQRNRHRNTTETDDELDIHYPDPHRNGGFHLRHYEPPSGKSLAGLFN